MSGSFTILPPLTTSSIPGTSPIRKFIVNYITKEKWEVTAVHQNDPESESEDDVSSGSESDDE